MKLSAIMLVLCASLMAQSKPPTATPPPATSPVATKPSVADIPVPPARALAIRDAQVEALGVQTQLQQLMSQRDAAQQKMQQAIKAAYDEAKLKDTEYSIDDRRWVFVPMPKPPAPLTPTPATGAKK
jgi:hypothetical protein